MPNGEQKINAYYTGDFIRVYQAFNNAIAGNAITHQKFLSPLFKLERTTWIKPSFLWMMYRSGWATKQNQEKILAIDITHEGFRWAIKNSVLSHFDMTVYKNYENWETAKENNPVVIQWDPERDIFLNKLNSRTIQIGLKPPAAELYVNDWVVKISDVTDLAREIKSLTDNKKIAEAEQLLPIEKEYIQPSRL